MKTIKIGDNSSHIESNRTFSGISLPFYLQNTTVNTAFDAVLLTLQNIQIKVILFQDGVKTVMCADNLRNLVFYSTFGKDAFRQFSDSQLAYSKIRLVHAGAVKAVTVYPIAIDFGAHVNLKGNDTLTIEYNLAAGCSQVLVDTAISYATLDLIDSVGIQDCIPVISSKVLVLNDVNVAAPLGDMVPYCIFANYDKESNLLADQVVSSMTFDSDKFKRNDNCDEILAKQRMGGFLDAKIEPFNSFVIYSGKVAMRAQLSLFCIGANVTASNNYILWQNNQTNPTLIARAKAMYDKHIGRDIQDIRNAA